MAGLMELKNMCGKHEIMWFNGGPCPDCTAGLPALQTGYVHVGQQTPVAAETTTTSNAGGVVWYSTAFGGYETEGPSVGLVDTLNPPLVVEADKEGFACPGTWGNGPCPETIRPADVVNGRLTCWRCSWSRIA